MALLVFLTVLTMITNSYVPAWMNDNERDHQNEVIDQFGDLKSDVDSMIVEQEVTGDNSVNMYAPIALGASGVPIFATPTTGFLTYLPEGSGQSSVHVWFTYNTTNNAKISVSNYGGGKVELYSPDRYYVQQYVAYENGAILVNQPDGSTIRAFPDLTLTRANGINNVEFTQINLLGSNSTISGTDSVGMNINLNYVDSQSYSLGGSSWSISVNSTYWNPSTGVSAWYTYLQSACINAGLSSSQYTLTGSQTTPTSGVYQVTLTIKNVGELNYNIGYVSMAISTG